MIKIKKNITGITPESVVKMQNTLRQQYKDGREVWNKGITENESESVKRQAESLRKNHHNNQFSEANSNWKGGIAQKYYVRLMSDRKQCECCGDAVSEIHHKDKNRKNNNIDNLMAVCRNCHRVQHKGYWVGKCRAVDRIKSITFIGEKDTYDIVMESPLNNFVANGFIVHNSTRYCNYNSHKFGSEITVIKPCFWSENTIEYETWKTATQNAEDSYNRLIALGATAQQARSVLPNSLKTEIVVTMNLREWRHFFELRTAKAAHPQMREIAIPLLQTFQERISIVFDDITADI